MHAVRFTHGLTIIIHKESFDILSLWAGELDVASVTSLAVYFLDTPGLVNVSEGTSRNRIKDLVCNPGCTALRRVAFDIRLYDAVLDRVSSPVLLQEFFVEFRDLAAP